MKMNEYWQLYMEWCGRAGKEPYDQANMEQFDNARIYRDSLGDIVLDNEGYDICWSDALGGYVNMDDECTPREVLEEIHV